jgi:hypothetical protein
MESPELQGRIPDIGGTLALSHSTFLTLPATAVPCESARLIDRQRGSHEQRHEGGAGVRDELNA